MAAEKLQQQPGTHKHQRPHNKPGVGLQKFNTGDRSGCEVLNGSRATRGEILALAFLLLAVLVAVDDCCCVEALLKARRPLHGIHLALREGNGDAFFFKAFPDLPAQITAYRESIQRVGNPEEQFVIDG